MTSHDEIDRYLDREHEIWLARHLAYERERARWSAREWRLMRLLAEARWEQGSDGMFLYAVEHAARQVGGMHALGRRR